MIKKDKNNIHKIFSYGTLQKESVQIALYGRVLHGEKAILTGFNLSEVEIKDPSVLEKSAENIHPILKENKNSEEEIPGMVFEITEEELLKTDVYETENYRRILANLDSGKKAWVYVA